MNTSLAPQQAPFTGRDWSALALVLAAGCALRLHGLTGESAWLDEAFSIGSARVGISEVLYQTRLDVHPPLYYVLLTGWLALFGDSVWSARLMSVVLSLAVVASACVIGSRLVDRRTGLSAAAVLAVSVFQIEFAQEARMYALLALLATWSTAGFIGIYGERRRSLLPYVVVTALMVWTHVYAVFVIGAQALSVIADLVWRRRQALDPATRWVWAQLFVLVMFLPWLPVFTWQLSLVQADFWIAEPAARAAWTVFRTYVGSPALLWLFVALAAVGLLRLARRREPATRRPVLFFLVPWLTGPILLPLLVSWVSQPIFLPKYSIAASIPFTILVAAGIGQLPAVALRHAVLAGAVAWSASVLPTYYTTESKDGWRDAVPMVEHLARPDDAVVLYPYFNKIAWDLYQRRDDLQVRAFPMFSAPPPPDGWPVTLARATAGRDRVWFVTLEADESAGPVVAAFADGYDLTAHHVRQKIAVYQFDRRR